MCRPGRTSRRLERRSKRVPFGVQRNHLMRPERVKSIGLPLFITKLDLERIDRQDLDDRSHLSSDKAKFRHIMNDRYGVEQMNR